MKKSNEPTQHLLISATTGSEWDTCNAAIIPLNKEWVELQFKRHSDIMNLYKDDYEFASIDFYSHQVIFIDDEIEELLGDDLYCFIDISEEELTNLELPEQRISCSIMRLLKDGNLYFSGYGKHTDEEFFTEHISIPNLLTKYL